MEQVIFSGKELQAITTDSQPFFKITTHAGTDSPGPCGANSEYEITWSFTRVN
jgi:hypothetical protein